MFYSLLLLRGHSRNIKSVLHGKRGKGGDTQREREREIEGGQGEAGNENPFANSVPMR